MLNRFLRPLLALLQQGLTPEKLALCVAVGVTFGIFPAIGTTTLLCAFIGFAARLNQPALQLVNYAMYPAHLALLIPFYRFGEWLFDAPALPLSMEELRLLFHSSAGNVIQVLWVTTLRAIVGWSLVAPLLAVAVYAVVLPIFRNAAERRLQRRVGDVQN